MIQVSEPLCVSWLSSSQQRHQHRSALNRFCCLCKALLLQFQWIGFIVVLHQPFQEELSVNSWSYDPLLVWPHLKCPLLDVRTTHKENTLSRSDWNWNHFIMRHYGKCHASEKAINIVKHEPSALSIQCLHVLFLGPGFIVDSFCSAV